MSEAVAYGRSAGRGDSHIPVPRRPISTSGLGRLPSNPDLLEATLAFAGSFVSDDGSVTIRRVPGRPADYSDDRFTGVCNFCARAEPDLPALHPLPDLRATLLFLTHHDHGETD